MPSFQTKIDARRQIFLSLSGQIEGQLRAAYDMRFQAKTATQSSLAAALGVNRSVIHHRLMGHTNMTIETVADMVWALGCVIDVKIYDPLTAHGCHLFLESRGVSQSLPAEGAFKPLATRNASADDTVTEIMRNALQAAS